MRIHTLYKLTSDYVGVVVFPKETIVDAKEVVVGGGLLVGLHSDGLGHHPIQVLSLAHSTHLLQPLLVQLERYSNPDIKTRQSQLHTYKHTPL